MSSGLNVGVIGLGRAGEKHAAVYNRLPFVRVAALCDTNPQRLESWSRELGAAPYSDYNRLLEDPSVEAVSIVLPDNMHRDAAEAAMRNGKHVLLEKPIASTLEDGQAICELATNYDKVFMVAHTLRFDPRHALARESVAKGELGELVHVSCRRNSTYAGAMMYKGYTDTHVHLMIHDIDYINWIIGRPPVKVFAKTREVVLKTWNMRDTIIALIEYEGGPLACVEACWILPSNSPTDLDDKMHIVGTKGAIYLNSCDEGIHIVCESRVHFPDSIHWPEVNGEISGTFLEELISFVNCVRTGRQPIVTAEQALTALQVVDAIERSLREQREVDVVGARRG